MEQRAAGGGTPPLGGWVVARAFGVPISVHPSAIVTVALLWVWAFTGLRSVGGSLTTGGAAWVAAVLALAFFASVLAHEVAHAVVARRLGQTVTGVAVFLLGGYTRLEKEADDPVTEFSVALVGPLANLTLGGILIVAGASVGDARPLLGGILQLVGELNGVVAAFNLLPGHPLDGGVLVRAAVWWRTGDRHRGARASAQSGRLLGYTLIGGGIGAAVLGSAEAARNGLWLALVGTFVLGAANTARVQARVRRRLDGLRVADLFDPAPWIAAPDWTVGRVVSDVVRGVRPGLIVTEGEAVGWFGPDELAELPSSRYDHLTLGEVMMPVHGSVGREDPVLDIVDAFDGRSDRVLAVTSAGRAVGSLPARAVIDRLLGGT